jgi:hypothetical protein
MAVMWRLSLGNQQRVVGGTCADDLYPEAVQAAEQGFAMLAGALGVVAPEHR